jgi:hypothetical protein
MMIDCYCIIEKRCSTKQSQHIAYLADGNFNDALKLTDATSSIETIRLTELLKYSIRLDEGTNAGLLLKWVDEMSKIGRENLKAFLEYYYIFLEKLFN